jgi:hypothetical protein
MDERRLARSKRALAVLVHAALVGAALAAAQVPRLARAQTAPMPATPAAAASPRSPSPSPAPPTAASPSPPAAAPQSAPTPAQLAEAKKFFEAGLKLMKEGLHQEALASFLEAYRIAPRESIQNNIALSYRNLKDFPSAFAAYEELLARFGGTMKPATKADAGRALEELAVLTGTLTVSVTEPDATVSVDGKPAGTTPLAKPVRVNVGTHTVTVAKPGYETLTREVTLRGHDDAPVDGPLEREVSTGHVTVTALPLDPTAKLSIDGAPVGPLPWQGELDPGVHVLEASGDRTLAAPKKVEITRKAKLDVTLDLAVQEGIVTVNAGAPDAEITIDGKLVGKGAWEGPVGVGKHELGVVKHGFLPQRKALLVHAGDRLAETVVLVPEARAASEKVADFKGAYSQIALAGLFAIGDPSNDLAQRRDLASGTSVDVSGRFGAGLGVRAGYSFGLVGIEGAVLGSYDHSSASAAYAAGDETAVHPGSTPRQETYDFHRFGAVVAAAVRLMPKIQTARPMLGVGAGVSLRGALYERSTTSDAGGGNSYTSDLATYVAPCIVIDGGVALGTTPGTRFYVGAMMLAELAGSAHATTSKTRPNGAPPVSSLGVANGVDVFLGPVIGMQLGQ